MRVWLLSFVGLRGGFSVLAAGSFLLLAGSAFAQSPYDPRPSSADPEVRRALPVEADGSSPVEPAGTPEPAAVRALPVNPATTTEPTVPTPRPAPLNFPGPTPATAGRPDPAPPISAAPSPAPSTSPVAVELAQQTPRRPGPASPATPGAVGSEGGEIRLAPGQSGGPIVTPDLLQLDAANNFYLKKQYAQAAGEYERYLGQYPTAPATDRQSALWFMAESYRNLKNVKAAQSAYEVLLTQFRDGDFIGPANYQLATIYYESKNYKAAAPLYSRSAALAKNNDVLLSALYYQALCLEKLGRGTETKELYTNVLAVPGTNPYRDTARTSLAREYLVEKQLAEALKQYEELARETARPALRAEATIKAGLLAREIAAQNEAKSAAATALNEKAVQLLTRGIALPEAGPLRGTAQVELLHLYYDTNRYQELVKVYAGALSGLPEDRKPEAMLLAGNAQRQLSRHAEAQNVYDALMAQFPNSKEAIEARYQRVVSLYSSGSPVFVQEADSFLAGNPDPAKGDQVKLMKADTLFKRENYAAAATAYAALETARNLPAKYRAEAQYRLGYCLEQSKQPEKAVEAFTKFLRGNADHPLAPKALAQRAVSYQQLKNYPAALADFSEIITNHPQAKEREIALEQKALIQGQQEDPRGMTDTFRLLLKSYPKSEAAGLAHFYIGTAAYDAKDFKPALAEFEAARKSDPKDYGARASLRVALCHYQLQDKVKLATEVEAYRKSKYQPDIPAQVLRWLGEAQLRDKEYAAAEANLLIAANSPTNDTPETWLKLARCRVQLKKPEAALEDIDKYLELAGENPPARALGLIERGEAELAAGRFDGAVKSAEEAARLQPEGLGNLRARLLAGDIDAARGNFDAAAKAYMSIAILTDDADVAPRALRKAVETFRKLNRPEDATRALDELKSRFPTAGGA